VRNAALDIAEERQILIAGWFSTTPWPEVQVTELAIGSSTLDVPTDEIAQLYAELVSRAGATQPARALRGAKASAKKKTVRRATAKRR